MSLEAFKEYFQDKLYCQLLMALYILLYGSKGRPCLPVSAVCSPLLGFHSLGRFEMYMNIEGSSKLLKYQICFEKYLNFTVFFKIKPCQPI